MYSASGRRAPAFPLDVAPLPHLFPCPHGIRFGRTSGASTKLRGADEARARIPGTRRVKRRVRPATSQTGAARAARNSASGCRADQAGSGKPLRLRIAPPSTGLGQTTLPLATNSRSSAPAGAALDTSATAREKSRRSRTPRGIRPRRLTHLTGPPARPSCPSASHPTTSIRAPDGARFEASRIPSRGLLISPLYS
jgi:hypothetical protein